MKESVTDLARKHGWDTVEKVRATVCKNYEKYDTCSVCLYWSRRYGCELIGEAESKWPEPTKPFVTHQ